MSSTIILPPDHETGARTAPAHAADAGNAAVPHGTLPRGGRFPEPAVEKIRGPKLVVLWLALIAGAWAVAAGAVYGLYVLVSPFLL